MGPASIGPSIIHGTGVFALRAFRVGDVILTLDDQREVREEAPIDPDRGELACHVDYVGAGRLVLAQPPERHINHSCAPNAYSWTIGGRRHAIALREIEPGDEITYDYSINSHWDTEWPCTCGTRGCRQRIASFFRLPEELQRRYLPLLDSWFVAEHTEAIETLRARLA